MLFDRIFETHCVQILSCSGFGVSVWFTTRLTFLAFQLSSPSFFTTFQTWFRLPHPSVIGIFRCVCTHPINVMGVHLLCCTHGNEFMGTHDAIWNTFVVIAWDVDFHVGWEQLHPLPSTTFHSFHWRVDIMLTKDGIHTLANVVIADPIWANLFHWSYAIGKFATFEIAQTKKRSYLDWHLTYHLIYLTIEVFRSLNKQVDMFLHDCTNAMWNFKGPKGPPFVCVNYFSSLKNPNYITKNASIFHLKSSNSNRSCYFPTSSPSRHTFHRYG
jgi:hypothetical protein